MMEPKPGLIDIAIVYGLGARCQETFDLDKVRGRTVRELIEEVISRPRPPGDPARTAKIIAGALRERRQLDIELIVGPDDETTEGEPVALDEVLFPEDSDTARVCSASSITLRASEQYRGGRTWPL